MRFEIPSYRMIAHRTPSARTIALRWWYCAVFATTLLSTPQQMRAQFAGGFGGGNGLPRVGGPSINDSLPGRMGGFQGSPRMGPMIGVRNPIGRPAANTIGDLTSGYAFYDNGVFMSQFGADTGLGSFSLFPAGSIGSSFRGPRGTIQEGIQFGLGPVMVSNLNVGAGAFYTDLDSPNNGLNDSGWASVLTLAADISATTPIVSVGARSQVYYLPFEDEWGWGVPGPFASFGIRGIWDPGIYYAGALRAKIGGWDLIAYDIFTGDYISPNLVDAFFDDPTIGFAQAVGPSSGGIDRVGRYAFGGAYIDRQPDASARFQFPRLANRAGSYFTSDRMFFVNSAGLILGRMLGPTTRQVNWFRRDDYWATGSFIGLGNYMSGGTLLGTSITPHTSAYATYEFGTFDEFQTIQHAFRVGTMGYLSESLGYSLNAGYFRTSGTRNDRGTGLADLMIFHFVGNRFMQYLGAGRGLSDATFGERYVSDYIQYGFTYLIAPNIQAQMVSGYYKTDGSFTQTNSSDIAFIGARLRMMLSNRTFLSLSSVAESYDFPGSGEQMEQWNHRVIYGIRLTSKTMGYAGYQYIDRNSNFAASTLKEHLLVFYLVHQF